MDYIISSNVNIKAEGIKCIIVSWISGQVDITKYDGDEIIFNESANRELDEDQMMRYKVSGNELKIQFSSNRPGLPRGLFNNLSKTLTLCIPNSLHVIDVDTVSAGISAESLSSEVLKFKTVSGSINALNLSVTEEIKVDTVSGSIYIDNIGTFREINSESVSGSIKLSGIKAFHNLRSTTVSGSINVQCMECPQTMKCSTVSGRIEVALPDNDGFDAKYSTVSGKMTCGFPCMVEKNRLIYKEGGAEFKFNTVSGGISINRA